MTSDWPIWFRFAVAVLATWRVANLVAREDGPFDLIVRMRARAGAGPLGRLMDCPYCLSLWVAPPFALAIGGDAISRMAAWLAVSGGACLLDLGADALRAKSARLTDHAAEPPSMLGV